METEESEISDLPDPNIREYIVNGRKNGYPDSVIIANLKRTKWPDDVIEKAIKLADEIVPAVPDVPKAKEQELQENFESVLKENVNMQSQGAKLEKSGLSPSNIPKQAPVQNNPEKTEEMPKPKEQAQLKEQKGFSYMSLAALLLSPFPFLGMAVAMTAIDKVKKNNLSGGFLAVIALIINIILILGLFWLLYKVFSLEPEQLTGLSKVINGWFGLV